jgi:hypothetical protein
MPTRPGFDVIPLRKETKARLAEMKGKRSFDDVLQSLLGAVSTGASPTAPASKPRDPEEQLALAEVAARRWRSAVTAGRIVERGPRLFVLHLRESAPRRTLHVEWTGRRGFTP